MEVVLKGILGREFGGHHEFYGCQAPVDVLRALEANFPGFKTRLRALDRWGYRLTTPDNSEGLELWQLQGSIAANQLVIRPVIAGAGGNAGRVLLGAALITAAFTIPFAAAGGGTKLGLLGASLLVQGIGGWLTPQPSIDEDGEASSSLSGSGALARRNDAVPHLIGYHRVTNLPVISSLLTSEDFVPDD